MVEQKHKKYCSDISCILLAGGKSERLQDKPFRILNGRPIVSYVLDVVKNIFEDVVIVVKNNQQVKNIRELTSIEKIIADNENEFSPATGIKKGIIHIKNNRFFLIACDMPFITEKIIIRLINYSKKYNCVVPFSSRFQPFCAVYEKNVFKGCAVNQSMRQIIENSHATIVSFDNSLDFFNINTLTDLKNAKSIFTIKQN